jgi:hypothetical protein
LQEIAEKEVRKNKRMNSTQRIVLAGAALVFTGMILFPPWLFIYRPSPSYEPALTSIDRSVGFHFIAAPPVPPDRQTLSEMFSLNKESESSDPHYFTAKINKDVLTVELVGGLIVAGLLYLLSRGSRTSG